MPEYDMIIIGSGPAGHTAAFEAAKNGLKTALVEKDLNNIGGVCLNEGCIPLKGMLHYSSHMRDNVEIQRIVREKTAAIRAGLLARLRKSIEIIEGNAQFISAGEIEAAGRRITSKYFLIATGSTPKRIFKMPNVHTPEKIFSLDGRPSNALLIGGGAIGCEYASFLNNVGTRVTIVEILDSIIPAEDDEAARTLSREFKKKRITVHASAKIKEIGANNEAVIITENSETKERFDLIIETAGRIPNTAGLRLENAGIALTEKGFIKVNASMRTSAPNIYAAGDCIDTPMLAYTAYAEAEAVINHIINKKTAAIDYVNMPRLVFSSPQAGGIGLTEKEAGGKGIKYHTYKYFFKAVGKAAVEGRDSGFLKLIAHKGRIIGAAAVGDEISDIMNELSIIINNKIKIDDIKRCMHIHPSYSEIIIDTLKHGG